MVELKLVSRFALSALYTLKMGNHDVGDVATILHLCHQVRRIVYWYVNSLYGYENSSIVDGEQPLFWQALAAAQLDQLETLFYWARGRKVLDVQVVADSLLALNCCPVVQPHHQALWEHTAQCCIHLA